jgi:hypothetical protein
MLKLKAIYDLPYKRLALTGWVLRDEWFPEIQVLSSLMGSDTLDILENEGRVEVRSLISDYIDGNRICEMATVWFDGKPVFIAQDAGRGGRDHRRRWLTDVPLYWTLVAYLLSKVGLQEVDHTDVADPEALFYEEEIFDFYGTGKAERFGFKYEPRAEGYCVMFDAHRIIDGASREHAIVMLAKSVGTPAAYIRRGSCVLELQGPLTQVELDSNPRLEACLKEDAVHDRYVWYRQVPRPESAVILSV